MSDAIGGAKRCSRVGRTRYCFLCGREVASGHKFVWTPVNRRGYYRLQHRDCDFPDCYDHSPQSMKEYSARMAANFGHRLTQAQSALLAALSEEG